MYISSNEFDKLSDVYLEHSKKGGGIIMANKKQLSSAQHVFDNVKFTILSIWTISSPQFLKNKQIQI